jgi:hypothetical protein
MSKPPERPFFLFKEHGLREAATAENPPIKVLFYCADGFVGERPHEGVRTSVETPNDPLPETNGLELRSEEVSPCQGVGRRRNTALGGQIDWDRFGGRWREPVPIVTRDTRCAEKGARWIFAHEPQDCLARTASHHGLERVRRCGVP